MRTDLFIFAAVIVLLQGCVARAGETITLALGSTDGLDKSTLQIFYVPQSTGVSINLTANIRSVLKTYPDRTSPASIADSWSANLTYSRNMQCG